MATNRVNCDNWQFFEMLANESLGITCQTVPPLCGIGECAGVRLGSHSTPSLVIMQPLVILHVSVCVRTPINYVQQVKLRTCNTNNYIVCESHLEVTHVTNYMCDYQMMGNIKGGNTWKNSGIKGVGSKPSDEKTCPYLRH